MERCQRRPKKHAKSPRSSPLVSKTVHVLLRVLTLPNVFASATNARKRHRLFGSKLLLAVSLFRGQCLVKKLTKENPYWLSALAGKGLKKPLVFWVKLDVHEFSVARKDARTQELPWGAAMRAMGGAGPGCQLVSGEVSDGQRGSRVAHFSIVGRAEVQGGEGAYGR